MNWTELLENEARRAYDSTSKLLDKVDVNSLSWKPASGCNWMTMGQLLLHISTACGMGCKGFVTGDWGLPDGIQMSDLLPEEMLPPADRLLAADSVEQVREMLADDKALAIEMIERAGEKALENREMAAPWAPQVQMPLGQWMLRMIQHLERHKSQLFYYLKLQGKCVNTTDLWGAD